MLIEMLFRVDSSIQLLFENAYCRLRMILFLLIRRQRHKCLSHHPQGEGGLFILNEWVASNISPKDSKNGPEYSKACHSTEDSLQLKECVNCQECLFMRIQINSVLNIWRYL